VLLNLVSNAVKFAEHGVVIRSAGVVARCVNRSTLRLSVRDTGDGIAIDRQAVIFESFTQADGSISRRYGGTGLGLSICRQLAGLMEGQIALASESGRGSEFRLELTLPERSGPHSIPGTKSISESPESVTTGPPAEPDRWRGVRVLVAEDNKTNQKVALRILDRLGCQADAVSNGREAVEMLDRVTYNLVLMDIQMPEMDGYHATAEIRRRDAARGGRLRVIAMTAHAMHGDRERCLAAGMDDYISKPVTYDMLAALLDRSCSASLSTRELTRGVPAREEHKPQILRFGRLREISAGDVKCEREMLQSFLQQTAASLIEFRSAFAQSDAVRIAGLAHSLLGACRTIGADSLAILCTDLEERSSKGKLPPYRRTLANLEREYLDLKATIMSYTEIIAPCVHSCDN
jgi:CheY-like chemotaxis protein